MNYFTTLLAITGFAFTTPVKFSESQQNEQQSQSITGMGAAVQVSQADFERLASAYQSENEGGTWGGAISKSQLQSLLNSMPSGSQYATLMFCTDANSGKTSLIIAGDKRWYQGSSKIEYRRNGGSDDAFCPMMCDNPTNADNITISLNHEEYTNLTNAYMAANPGQTRGGRIDRAALSQIINSLPVANTAVRFRFCKDESTSNTSVIFIGGNVGQENNANLYFRNGLNADAFCPMMCD